MHTHIYACLRAHTQGLDSAEVVSLLHFLRTNGNTPKWKTEKSLGSHN